MRSLAKVIFAVALTVFCSGCIVVAPAAVWGLAAGANGINRAEQHTRCKDEREAQAINPPATPYNWTDHDPADDLDDIKNACKQKPSRQARNTPSVKATAATAPSGQYTDVTATAPITGAQAATSPQAAHGTVYTGVAHDPADDMPYR